MQNFSIRFSTKYLPLNVIVNRIKNSSIALYPEFRKTNSQSYKFWNDSIQSKIIESILIGIPMPAFYADASDNNEWLLIDGFLRLYTIRNFIIDQNFSLTNLDFLTEYDNMKYNDLHKSVQHKIEETSLTFHLLQPDVHDDIKVVIYKRLRNELSLF